MKTLAIHVLAWSALSTPAVGQSFDYPEGSSSLFNRGQDAAENSFQSPVPSVAALDQQSVLQTHTQTHRPQVYQPSAHRSPAAQTQNFQTAPQQNSAKPSMFSKLFSRRGKSKPPTFASPYLPSSNSALPENAKAYDTRSSAYINPAQANSSNPVVAHADHIEVQHNGVIAQASDPLKNVKGYQPMHAKAEVQRVNFDQYSSNSQHSVFESANHELKRSSVEPNSVSHSGNGNSVSSIATSIDKTAAVKETAALVVPPAAKVAQRVALPRDAFKEEFEKAYKYINPSSQSSKKPAARIAQSQDSTRELQFEDFAPAASGRSLGNDFSAEDPLMIAPPEFIPSQPSEQSPNAEAPSFNPQSFGGRIDTLPSDKSFEPDASPQEFADESFGNESFGNENSTDGNLNNSDFANEGFANDDFADTDLPESADNTVAPIDSFSDDLGSLDQWEPPKPSTTMTQKSLEEDLAELSKPFTLSPADNKAKANPAFETAINQPASVLLYESPVWWKQQVVQPLHPENQSVPIDSNGLVFAAIQNSPRIQAVSQNPLIRELQVVEADANFDPVRFVRSQFEDRVDPVGNVLDVGFNSTAQFLKRNIWTAEAGVQRKLRTGADVEVSQQLGFQNSNSQNFTPQDQGTATLALNVTQPLLRGRGRYFNQAQILIAQSTGGVAWEVFQQELQEELEGVVTAYWQLYLDRSIYLQRKRNVERGQVILDRLNGRRELDSLPAQISRARSSVLTRKTELANAFRNVRNAETEIRRRVADRNWMASQSLELLPAELPTIANVGLELDQVVQTALNHRPEIRESMRRIKISGIQRDISENELLPELSVLFGTYVSALQGESDVLGAFGDQFGEVTPGYSFGLEYELPRRNRAARSRFQQRHLQFKRLQAELEEVIQNVIAESQISLRRINSAIETLAAAEEAIVAARADLKQNETRWESFALVEGDIAEGVTPTTVLDQLLDSQERLAQAEIVYAQAEQELKVAEVALQRSMGTLLMHQQVSYDRQVISDTPYVYLQKQSAPSSQSVPSSQSAPSPQSSGQLNGQPIYSDEVYSQQQPFVVE